MSHNGVMVGDDVRENILPFTLIDTRSADSGARPLFGANEPPGIADRIWRRFRHKLHAWFGSREDADDNWSPAGGAVLVVAPHPDDEVIGCGGTLLRHADAGDEVTVAYLTRGESSRGYPWLTAEERQATRVAEAKASCGVLHVSDTIFLDGADGHCAEPQVAATLQDQLADVIHSRQPKVIYVPHADDNHPDHAAAYRLVREIVQASDLDPIVYQYELWSPMSADFAVDVSGQMKRKIKAIKRHHLALDAFDYVPTMIGLAAYRSGTMLQRKGYAEAFKRTA